MKRSVAQIILAIIVITPALIGQTALPAPKQETLLNGLKVLMWPDAKADKVEVKLRIHSGSAFDPQGKEGLMQMLADNFFPNEATREFFKDDLGGDLEVVTIYDYIQINAFTKPDAESFLKMLETVSAALSNPVIDRETTAKLRTALLAKVASLETEPAYIADAAAAKRLFGTFPYGRPQLGTAQSLKKIDFPDLVDAKNRFLNADNATLALSGKFDKTAALRAIKRYFGGWSKADKKIPATFRQPDEPSTDTFIINSPKTDTSIARIAYRGVAARDKELPAAILFGDILQKRLGFPEGQVTLHHYLLTGMFVVKFPINGTDLGIGNGKRSIPDLVTAAISQQVTESEFQGAKKHLETYLPDRTPADYWLDGDTYNITDVRTETRKSADITIAEVRSFADKLRRSRPVIVLVTSQPN